ncbi:uncharacterized protein N7483_004767 [Penicillium malachiteum]|uniref:uncharacterized protein n=1 Tax=Penicillium malachiteum TaxID=1324776 RepID=UPI002547BBB5|nr:uncharacterized protein N7483_004767 [Penicillium malachiteum]KAJ5730259.1 hypothetical protein N7483_004767 [Penicillium malachiteum]
MPNVLILGGTGYIGNAVAKSLLQSGNYKVWGTARNSEKAKQLAINEIVPIEDDITDPAKLSQIIIDNSINVVVDTTSAYEQAGNILAGVIHAATTIKESLEKEGIVSPRLGFVYTSGGWVYGSPKKRLNDLAPVGSALSQDKPGTPIVWRPIHEQAILAARDQLDVAILRPHAVYGRGSWIFGTWWNPLAEAAKSGSTSLVKIPANTTARPGLVHVDDVATGFHAAIDRIDGRLGEWPIFDLLTETLPLPAFLDATKVAMGVDAQIEYIGPGGNPFYEALSLASNSDASRAKSVLGWNPKRTDLLLNLPIYVNAWQASQ